MAATAVAFANLRQIHHAIGTRPGVGADRHLGAPQLRTNLTFYRGKVKVLETPVVERTSLDAADRRAAVFQFEVPASKFKPGLYTCQVNIIDAPAGKFAFPRLQMYVR